MERVGTLINKLKEQFDQHANAEQLAVTVQLLLAELQSSLNQSPVKSKISVVLPSVMGSVFQQEPEMESAAVHNNQEALINAGESFFDVSREIPTLAHQNYVPHVAHTKILEFNTALAQGTESLNEKLKDNHEEVATALQGTPIRDLKKGIGVNDRFLFVQDLFRGDENMFERSLKTINAFNIYPEAEYWIQRELKVKLSWPDNSETVKLFDQLVKRRFS
jgi:hypothetical protein